MFFYNGNLNHSTTLELPIAEPGLLYGATVFTTLRVYDNSLDHHLTQWAGHCRRLKTSLDGFQWPQPDWQRLRSGAERMMAHWSVLRIAIFPDGRELITGRIIPQDLANRQEIGIKAWVADDRMYVRSLPTHKTGNYLCCWLALQGAQRHHCQEAILINEKGDWLETSTGNLWGWKDGRWWTPPVEAGILPGVMRSQLLQWLETQHQGAIAQPWTAEVVAGFEAIAYSNSVVQIIPLREIRHQNTHLTYDPHHPALAKLRKLFP
jgi:4-amino-4-deoxychorismate lyase